MSDSPTEVLAGSIERVTFPSAGTGCCLLRVKASVLRASAPTTADGIEKVQGAGMIRGIGPIAAVPCQIVDVFALQVVTGFTRDPQGTLVLEAHPPVAAGRNRSLAGLTQQSPVTWPPGFEDGWLWGRSC